MSEDAPALAKRIGARQAKIATGRTRRPTGRWTPIAISTNGSA
jgi:hypothetical protein